MPRRAPGAGASLPPTAFFLPDTLHFPAGAAPLIREPWSSAAGAGLDEAAAACGLLLEPPRLAWHAQPPRWQWQETAALGTATLCWRLLTRAHWRARLRAATGTPALVRQDAHWWHGRGRTAVAARHTDLAGTAAAGLDDRALAAHLSAVLAQYASTVRTAVRLYTGALLTLGAWLRLGGAHLRASPAALAGALPPIPPAFDRPTARALLDPAARQTRPTDPLWGWRLMDGVDPAGSTLGEDLALAAALARACADPPAVAWRAQADALLDNAPARHFRALRDAWEDACALRLAHVDALRTGPATAGGLVRAALLEAQRRLAARTDAPVAVFDLPADAVVAALAGAALAAPLPPPPPPPARTADPELGAHLPGPARERVLDLRAGLTAWLGAPTAREPVAPDTAVPGTGQPGRAGGALVQVAGVAELWRAPPGSVALCTAASAVVGGIPANVTAIVTRYGGIAAAAADGARSAGIPGVHAVGTALDAWPAGCLVRVDGDAGQVSRA